MLFMICLRRLSTSSKGQFSRIEFWLISRALVATPPALAALAGPKDTLLFRNTSTASGVLGMLAPSATTTQPFFTSVLAAASLTSFCVAHGSATSHGTVQMFWQSGKYLALLR